MLTVIIRETGELRTFFATLEGHSPSVAITRYPIEDGSVVNDHAQREVTPVVFDVLVSRTPFGLPGDESADDADLDALDFLERCVGKALDLVSVRKGTLENHMLSGWPHEFTRRKAVGMTLTFVPVVFAEAVQVTLPARRIKPNVRDQMDKDVDGGGQPKKKVAEGKAQKDVSFLRAKGGDPTERANQLADFLGI